MRILWHDEKRIEWSSDDLHEAWRFVVGFVFASVVLSGINYFFTFTMELRFTDIQISTILDLSCY